MPTTSDHITFGLEGHGNDEDGQIINLIHNIFSILLPYLSDNTAIAINNNLQNDATIKQGGAMCICLPHPHCPLLFLLFLSHFHCQVLAGRGQIGFQYWWTCREYHLLEE